MNLSKQEKEILAGQQGSVLQKVLKTVVLYGEALGAERLADIESGGHFALGISPGVGLRPEMLEELVRAGLHTGRPFTLDPLPPCDEGLLQVQTYEDMVRCHGEYNRQMLALGLRDVLGYTCTPYMDEVGNIPKRGAILAWSESSAVIYVNSVLGARTNRNAVIMDLLSNLAGKTPFTGLLTDEGRRAKWLVEVNTEKLPHPQLLGGAIGKKVLDETPFITGLDRFLGAGLTGTSCDYLKEMGTTCAAIGAVGLYHVENMTPEAVEQGRSLLVPNYKRYTIDDQELADLFESYPVMWEDKREKPRVCLIGCPHLSLRQLYDWTGRIVDGLAAAGRNRVALPVILAAAPQVLDKFMEDGDAHRRLLSAGVSLSATCFESALNESAVDLRAAVTNSNKLRAFTSARLVLDDELLRIIIGENPLGPNL